MAYNNKNYMTWYDFEDKKLRTWDYFQFNRKEFFRKKREGKLVDLYYLQPNQNRFDMDDDGIYRTLRGERWYIYTIRDLEKIKKERNI